MQDVKTIRVGEMFAGIGGFRLGLQRASNRQETEREYTFTQSGMQNTKSRPERRFRKSDFRIVWANEWDKYACQIYRKNFGEKELFEGDIRKINTNDIPDIDLLVGGFPCQPHSLAGKRQGFSDERGTVFHEIIRVAKAKRPTMLLLENVKGLLSSEAGKAFGTVLEELGNIGYWCEWKTLNSKYFGVPQNRERVFIIGHLRGGCTRQIFPIEESSSVLEKEPESKDICPTITSRYYKRGKTDPYIFQQHSHSGPDGKGRGVRMFEGVCPTLESHMGTSGNNVPMVMACLTPDRPNKRQNGRRFKEDGEPMFTLTGQDVHGVATGQGIRRLTPTECERLQGFPDGWTEGVSDTQRYKTIGNAVTIPVIQEIGKLIFGALD